MGKGTDKLYLTHSEWADESFASGVGSGASKSSNSRSSFRRLPFNYCSLSFQPFNHPVCTSNGTIFDLTNILPWIKKHGTNPVDGTPLKSSDLIKLHFVKNENKEYVDPATYKAFTDNTHIVALKPTGNVYAYNTIEKLNIKPKLWQDIVDGTDFTRKDIITLQDPQNLDSRDLSSFKHFKEGSNTLTPEQEESQSQNINTQNIGNAARILKAKEAVAKSRAARSVGASSSTAAPQKLSNGALTKPPSAAAIAKSMPPPKSIPYNAAPHTTGKAAASFTSTAVSVHTSNERALLSEEEYLLKPRRVKQKGYARISTSHGPLNIELHTEFAPKAVWNFISLAKRSYYKGINFHRNIRNFMIQTGDPTGTGKGGQSIWNKPFSDEYGQSPLKHDARGVISMANKGKNTNTSQFFITYRAASHLDRKHTIFGRVILDDSESGVESTDTLTKLENVKTENDRPVSECFMEDVTIFIDPFEEYKKSHDLSKDGLAVSGNGKGDTDGGGGKEANEEDDNVTWSGKRIRADGSVANEARTEMGVGKYLNANVTSVPNASGTKSAKATLLGQYEGEDEVLGEYIDDRIQEEDYPPPSKKQKRKAAGFGDFDGW